MSEEANPASLHTELLHRCVDKLRAGDPAAADDLLRASGRRLDVLARKMLKRFPTVGRWEQTSDVLQNALLRLLRALADVRPASTREYYALAGVQMRRELLDLARKHQGARGLGKRQAQAIHAEDSQAPGIEPVDDRTALDDLDLWSQLHEAVETLPAADREVFSLVFYHGWSQKDIGDLLEVDERTVRRRWAAAAAHLHEALGGRMPGV